MKIIDIHTKKETKDFNRYENPINGNLVKDYILQHIDFPISHKYLDAIDKSFSEIWNNKIGIGGYFYLDEISKQIFSELQNQKMLIEFERIDKVVNLILTYIENDGGFLE
jgi:hypothetical protein